MLNIIILPKNEMGMRKDEAQSVENQITSAIIKPKFVDIRDKIHTLTRSPWTLCNIDSIVKLCVNVGDEFVLLRFLIINNVTDYSVN